MLLTIVLMGLTTGSGAGFLVYFMGIIFAALLSYAALVALGYEGGNPLKFLNPFSHVPIMQSLMGGAIAVVAVAVFLGAANLEKCANWLLMHLPQWLAPKTDLSLAVVFLSCLIFMVIAGGAFLLDRRTLQRLNADAKATMNREHWRQEKITKQEMKEFRAQVQIAQEHHDYWIEALLTLALAAVAVVPGALGWPWLWGVALSIVLPMFVLSVRFRMKNQVASSTGNSIRVTG
ncbi:hypothetical protein [Arthrobacter alpinus]|nr:hypothetical protein [Arthrobacter alpinus]